uniref:Uncharacterized protein n=1 Tax=Anopheles coluzzii TaxID=1518534 RepID=A0A8W7P830_ANOCL
MNHVTGTPTSHAREHNPRTPTQPAAGKKNGNLVENHTGKDIPRITTTDGDCATAPWAALQCPLARLVSATLSQSCRAVCETIEPSARPVHGAVTRFPGHWRCTSRGFNLVARG